MEIFFDLEGTIIDDFDNFKTINVNQVRAFLEANGIFDIQIFSAAVWDANDVERVKDFKLFLNSQFGFNIVGKIPTIQDMKKSISRNRRISTMSDADFFDLFTKDTAFIEFCRDKKVSGILIDDMVPNMKMEIDGLTIQTINIKEIVEHPLGKALF